ncbi:hypothetical protein MAINES_00360 [Brevundimonas phage vB_BpoS-MaInes]|nr:hypothetical protein MAINES_00360 [Brevundimonas phage vB_BpoS-MaInes]
MYAIKHVDSKLSSLALTLLHLGRGITKEEAIAITKVLQQSRPDSQVHLVEIVNRPEHLLIDLDED